MVVKPKPCSEYLAVFLVGLKFNTKMDKPKLIELTQPLGKRKKGLFQCACGKIFEAALRDVKYLHTKSCGCLKIARNGNPKHNMCYTKQYKSWSAMITRCTKSNSENWKYYGGRGITVCDKWMKFSGFWEDMGSSYVHGYTIDRINCDLGYFKENCRWLTMSDQCNNKRSNHLIEYNGELKTIAQLARMCPYPIKYRNFHWRLITKKMTVDEIFNEIPQITIDGIS